jgi:SIR2-like domain
LDVEHYLGLRGSDTWSADGNEGQVVVKTLIGEILTERTPSVDRIPVLYRRFASSLRPFDYVLTFNYDVLLERALRAVGKPFRLYPSRHRTDSHSGRILDLDTEEVVVLKLHGSVDWFDRTQHRTLHEDFVRKGFSGGPRHPVFGHERELEVRPVVDSPGYEDDPLSEMFRVGNLDLLYSKDILFHATPWLLAPSTAKILYADRLREFWYGLGGAGAMNFGMAIIGYSLPAGDRYARQIIYEIARNYQTYLWEEDTLGNRKTPLVVVDRRTTLEAQAAFDKLYAFINWERAKRVLDGFDEGVLQLFQ